MTGQNETEIFKIGFMHLLQSSSSCRTDSLDSRDILCDYFNIVYLPRCEYAYAHIFTYTLPYLGLCDLVWTICTTCTTAKSIIQFASMYCNV